MTTKLTSFGNKTNSLLVSMPTGGVQGLSQAQPCVAQHSVCHGTGECGWQRKLGESLTRTAEPYTILTVQR